MFTSDGELRPDYQPEEPPPKQSPPPPAPPPAAASSPGRSGAVPGSSESGEGAAGSARPARQEGAHAERAPADELGPEPSEEEGVPREPMGEFSAIVRSLATTAYSALGLIGDPTGVRRRDPAVARQMIDWLGVLESKTRNNLSFEESDFLSRVLYELRLAFVEVTRPAGR